MAKDCAICGKEIGGDDPRKLYCSNACKQEAHRVRHGLSRPDFLQNRPRKERKASLIAVDSASPGQKIMPVLHQVENDRRFLEVNHAIVEIDSSLKKLQIRKNALLEELAKYQRRDGLTDTARVMELAADLNKSLNTGGDVGVRNLFVGLGLAFGIHNATNTNYNIVNLKNRYKASILKDELNEIESEITKLQLSKIQFENTLAEIRKEIRQEIVERTTLPTIAPKQSIPRPATIVQERAAKDETQVISLQDFKQKEFDVYKFSEGFEEIIGNPEKDFSMLIYGQSGHGKSTWVIRFANYLAENHGRVLYNSSEEKIGYSLKRKLLEFDSPNFSIAEAQTYKGLKQTIRGNGYKFVVIDSVNNMRIDPKQLQELRESNPDKAFIFIMQSTKGGDYKGSTEYAHDADIIIKMENYTPNVEKTRYKG